SSPGNLTDLTRPGQSGAGRSGGQLFGPSAGSSSPGNLTDLTRPGQSGAGGGSLSSPGTGPTSGTASGLTQADQTGAGTPETGPATGAGSGLAQADQMGAGTPGAGRDLVPPQLLPDPLPMGSGTDSGSVTGSNHGSSGGGGSSGTSAGQNPGLALDSLLGTQGQPPNANSSSGNVPTGAVGLSLGSALGSALSSMAGTSGSALSSMGGASSASSGPPPGSSGVSGLSLGSDAGSTPSGPKEEDSLEAPLVKSRFEDRPTKKIQVPFEIVVVCGAGGLMIHPGGYQISGPLLESQRKDSILVKELLAVANQRAAADPSIRPLPRVKFLVESGGGPMFWAARKQILFSGLGWPMSLQVTGTQNPHMLGQIGW
ncbi:MAG: hypothetical protein ACP5XB_13580, partial [Isosphaeraceae bacterium]